MAIVDTQWDGNASNYKDTNAYCSACLIDTNPPGKDKVQAMCKLPVKTPDGDINSNAVHSAAGALAGARNKLQDVSPADKKKAAKALIGYYRQMKEPPPDSLKRIAQ